MEIALIILSVALAICLYLLIFRPGSASGATSTSGSKPTPRDTPPRLDNNPHNMASFQEELNAKAAELHKAKGELQKNKEELRQSKQKLFEAREKNKQVEAELKIQKQLERQALQQAEHAQLNLAELSTELDKLRLELETQKPSKTAAPSMPPQAAEAAKPTSKPAKLLRELHPSEKEKLENAERLISRAQELEKELKSLKIRMELVQRQLKTFRSSEKLQKDKFRAIEKRLNRTLLERDFILRAMRDLETRCGLQATLPELPEEEPVAESPEEVAVPQEAPEDDNAANAANAAETADAADAAETEKDKTEMP